MAETKKYSDELYHIVPALYRNRDTGDLAKFFEGAGLLLDQLYATIAQRAADSFPDNPVDGSPGCQDWLLPYFADLLDVRLVSPLVKGRRDEVANAIRWRQGKGTLRVIEEIAQSIGQLEVVVQEGWQRVAITPRLDTPRIPATNFGYDDVVPMSPPSIAARHPGLVAATVDFRCPSGAVATNSGNPAAEQSTVDGDTHIWRQASYHGAPCYPGSYEDVSRRTVDFRCPDWRIGHYHPDNILLFAVPPAGLFEPAAPGVNWSSPAFDDLVDVIEDVPGQTTYRNKTYGTEDYVPVRVSKVINLGQDLASGDPNAHLWRFEGLVLMNKLEVFAGRIEFVDCAARTVQVNSVDPAAAVVKAKSCLLKRLRAPNGVALLDYCTVLDVVRCERMLASDSIFLDEIRKGAGPPDSGCVRYSRIAKTQVAGGMRFSSTTRLAPVMFSTQFGERGCGVLHPATPDAVCRGAEDGGEMGAYHDDYLSLLAEAIVDKLSDYLPVGAQAVVIPDPRLLEMPG